MKYSNEPLTFIAMITVLLYFNNPVAPVYSQNNPASFDGTVTSIDKTVLSVKLSDGSQKKVTANDKTRFIRRDTVSISDIKTGDALGVTSAPGPDNMMIAKAINIFPSGMLGRIRNGQFPMGDSGNTMTNAEGMSDILVPDDIQVTRMILLEQSDV
jgi:hypothetical protein